MLTPDMRTYWQGNLSAMHDLELVHQTNIPNQHNFFTLHLKNIQFVATTFPKSTYHHFSRAMTSISFARDIFLRVLIAVSD
jgi:hypothetical protein